MERLLKTLEEAVLRTRSWMASHHTLGGEVLAPACAIIFMALGFCFLARSLMMP